MSKVTPNKTVFTRTPMRTPTTTLFKAVKLKKPNGKRTWMIQRRSHGKRERIYFETEKEAKREASDRNRKIDAHGTTVKLTPEEQIYAQACITDLAEIGKTLRDATDYYLAAFRRPPAPSGNTLADRILKEYARRSEAGEISERHVEAVRETVSKFRLQYGETPIDRITAGNIKEWLSNLPLAVKTRNRHLGYVSSMFQLAVREWDLLEKNPLAGIKKFSDPHNGRRISIFTPEELQTVLSSATKDWLPIFAINALTGLRRAEVERLDWSEIKLDRRLIDLPFTKSKNGRRKLIQMPDNLSAILSPPVKAEGPVMPNRRFDLEVKRLKESGIKWPANVLRHSFCSYAVALHGFVWTAEQADHSEVMLKKHYREVVTREAAERYFAILG
jgi:integrase